MKTITMLLIFAGSLVAFAPSARAGWLSNLNPFAKKSADGDAASSSSATLSNALGSSKFNSRSTSGAMGQTVVPELDGRPIHPVNSMAPAAPKGPSLFSRIKSAPGNLLTQTKGLFHKTPSEPAQKRTAFGSPSGGSQFNHSGSMAVRRPTTASQFIGQPRPGF